MQSVACPYCRKLLANDGTLAGQAVACPLCGGQFLMPPAAAAPAPQPAAPATTTASPSAGMPAGAYRPSTRASRSPLTTSATPPRRPAAAAPPVAVAPAAGFAAGASAAQFLPRPESVSESLHRHTLRRRRSPTFQVGIMLAVLFVILGIGIVIGTYLWLTQGQDSPWYQEGYRAGREVGRVARLYRWSYNPFPGQDTLRTIKGLPGRDAPEYKYFCDGYRRGYEDAFYDRAP